MKKTLISLATASLIASSAMAADKGIDFTTTGQAVVYYETHGDNGKGADDIFNKDNSVANVGIQLNLASDLGNNFTFGSQITYIGTDGLEKNLVSGVKQTAGTTPTAPDTTSELALTKIFIAKQIANTTVKLGRQELPKSLSPLAFTEGWNVFKNTFDAALIVNSDLPNTTIVAAYIGKGSGMDLGSMGDPVAKVNNPALGNLTAEVSSTAYMLTVQNTALPMTTITGSYYSLSGVGASLAATTGSTNGIHADALWLNVSVADKSFPMGLKADLQAGMITPDDFANVKMESTTAMGAKVSVKAMPALTLTGAFSFVSGSKDKTVVAIKNTGTGIKSPLFTQMVYNQDAISLDAKTLVVKGVYSLGDMGKVIAQYGFTDGGARNLMNAGRKTGTDYSEFDLMYKLKAGGVQYFAALINRSWSEKTSVNNGSMDSDNKFRVWGRYAF